MTKRNYTEIIQAIESATPTTDDDFYKLVHGLDFTKIWTGTGTLGDLSYGNWYTLEIAGDAQIVIEVPFSEVGFDEVTEDNIQDALDSPAMGPALKEALIVELKDYA